MAGAFLLILLGFAFPPSRLNSAEPPPTDKGTVSVEGRFIPRPATGEDRKAAPPILREDAEATLRQGLKIDEIAPGKLKIGLVTLDRAIRSVRFPAIVNMVSGPVEYAVVTTTGKVHEAIFATRASPRDIHLAMLLLGVQSSPGSRSPDGTLHVPDSAAVRVSIEWETNGPSASNPLASIIALAEGSTGQPGGRTMTDGNWLYQGSSFDAGGFTAMREGSVISIIGDPTSLVNNAGVDRGNDDIHVPNKALLPAKGMPVTIVLTMVPPSAKKPAPVSPAP